MIIENKALLIVVALRPKCEVCGAANKTGLDPHHILAKGMGGGGRLDHPWNLIATCRLCHTNIHMGTMTRKQGERTLEALLAIVAEREGVSVDEIERELYRLRRLPKGNVA